nr:MAG TPA: hypothetical protein [Caudoviricetes sp.]
MTEYLSLVISLFLKGSFDLYSGGLYSSFFRLGILPFFQTILERLCNFSIVSPKNLN